MGKTADMLGGVKFRLPQINLSVKIYAAGREGKIELLMLVSDFTVKFRLKILNDISMEFIECLKKGAKQQ